MTTSQLMQLRFFPTGRSSDIAISKKWIERWDLQEGKTIPISFGSQSAPVKIHEHRGAANELWLSKDLANKLLIPYADPLWVKLDKNQLVIGPIVGIWTTGISSSPTRPFGIRTELFKQFLQAQYLPQRGACYFIFHHRTVDWNSLTVEGIFWRHDGTKAGNWEIKRVPFPDVIYNRIPNRNQERELETISFIKQVENRTKSQIFNEKFFQKWEVHKQLSQFKEVQQWIPETWINPTEEILRDMLNRYKMIYLKPVGGSLGIGIYQLLPGRDGSVIARFRINKQNVARRYASVRSYLRQEFNPRKIQRYVAQQGINLININGFPIDFRVHLNKNIKDEWEITGIGAKMAGKGSVTTHVRTGGKVLSTEQVLNKVFAQSAEKVMNSIKNVCILIARALEKTTNGPLGELGLDVGIDESGNVWLFEANSKPGRSIFKTRYLKEYDLYSAALILDYSTHLTKFA